MAAVKRMKQAFNLFSSSEKFSDEDKDYIHFYCAVRSILFKLTKGDAPVSYTHLDVYKRQNIN